MAAQGPLIARVLGPERVTPAQLDDLRAGGRLTIVGAHFVGLHAIQALALAALALRRWRRSEATRVRPDRVLPSSP